MSLVVNPYSYFTDTNGNALNGYLYVGEVGKNAENYPIAIFYDALFTTPAPNPLTISAGYIYNSGTIAQIYASVDYSIVVKKTDGSLVYSSLNETGMTNEAIANIDEMKSFVAPYDNYALNVLGYSEAGDGGGGLFYYDANSTEDDNGGTIIEPTSGSGRWVRQYSGAVNVKWFGAVGDGVTDDTEAIQTALGLTGYKVIYFPTGTYKITDNTSLGIVDNVELIGDEATIYYDDHEILSGSTPRFTLQINNDVKIRGMKFISAKSIPVVSTSSTTVMLLVTGSEVQIEDCYFEGAEQDCILLANQDIPNATSITSNVIIKNCEFTRYGRIAICGTDCSNVLVDGNYIYNSVNMDGATTALINGGIWFESDVGTQDLHKITIVNNNINDVRVPISLSSVNYSTETYPETGLIANNVINTSIATGTGTGTNLRCFVVGRGNAKITSNSFNGIIYNYGISWGGGTIDISSNKISILETILGIYSIYEIFNTNGTISSNTFMFLYSSPKTLNSISATASDGLTHNLYLLDPYTATNAIAYSKTQTSGTYNLIGSVGNEVIFKPALFFGTLTNTISLGSTPTIIPFASSIENNISNSSGTFTIIDNGIYEIESQCLVMQDTAVWSQMSLFIGNIQTTASVNYKTGGTSNITLKWISRLSAGDTISIRGGNDGGSSAFYQYNGSFVSVKKISGYLYL